MASTSKSGTPRINLPAEDQDKLSDYIPGSTEISRQPSRAVSDDERAKNEPEDDEDEEGSDENGSDDGDDDELESDGAGSSSGVKKQTYAERKRESRKQETKRKKDAKNAVKSQLSSRRQKQAGLKSSDSIKRFSYLLGQTELFRHFCDLKAQREPEFAAMLAESEKALSKGKSAKKGKQTTSRGRKTEKEEDEELMAEEKGEDEDPDGPFVFTESPAYVKGGKMRDYQVQGLNWMCGLHHNGINGILADEMGLGKTLQTISFLGFLKYHRELPGPHLVVVPKSTLENWAREFEKWVPGFSVVMLQGSKEERQAIINERILPQSFEVLLTSYEICLREKSALKKLSWEYIVIDEAHRIKNVDSMLSQIVRIFDSRGRLLITGTPLQNNLQELWALLNFLLPDVFSSVEDFNAWFEKQAPADEEGLTVQQKEQASNNVVKQLHAVLRPFLLRRVKADVEKSLLPKKEINVYVGMTELQRKWYKMLLEKDIDAVNGMTGKKEGKTRLLNIVMQLRKCCNHPYLFDGAEPGPPFTTDEHLIEASGKLVILDKLLKQMKAKGSRVLIFSQMSRLLDILEDYCLFREYQYCRLDGSTSHDDRMEAIDAYNKPGSEKFIFLLTTRAGGLGINLTSADIVVLYDSDWNPQADLQAMDRAHRIGQQKQVYVYRFVTENAVEEKVLERAAQKLRLDQLVIQQGRATQTNKLAGKDDLVEMIQHGAEKIINAKEPMMDADDDIDAILSRGEQKTKELNSRYEALNFDDLQHFKSETATNWEGESYGAKKILGRLWIEPSKRERKSNYSIDGYYRSALNTGSRGTGARQRGPKAFANEWQFPPHDLFVLQDKEDLWQRKKNEEVVPELTEEEMAEMTPEEVEKEKERRQAEREDIEQAEPLNDEELAYKEELEKQSFTNWSKREYQAFVRGCESYGRANYEGIAHEIGTKNADEVKQYARVFWERYAEFDDAKAQVKKIEVAEAKRNRDVRQSELVKKKVESVAFPLQTMKIHYANQTKGKSYSEDEDRFLLCELAKYGIGKDDTYEQIKRDILQWPGFRFDWFIKSRSPLELARRCLTLITLVEKEYGIDEEVGAKKGGAGSRRSAIDKGAATNGAAKKRKLEDEGSNASGSRASTPATTSSKKMRK